MTMTMKPLIPLVLLWVGTGQRPLERTVGITKGVISMTNWSVLVVPRSWQQLTVAKSSKWLSLGEPQMRQKSGCADFIGL
ncbi:hypothetical protein DL96DRAFT_1634225, partial [Flagelloscypha sp. PMI_526]